MKNELFGRKSEKLTKEDCLQLRLFNEAEDALATEVETAPEEIPVKPHSRKKRGFIQTDGYVGYDVLGRRPASAMWAGLPMRGACSSGSSTPGKRRKNPRTATPKRPLSSSGNCMLSKKRRRGMHSTRTRFIAFARKRQSRSRMNSKHGSTPGRA